MRLFAQAVMRVNDIVRNTHRLTIDRIYLFKALSVCFILILSVQYVFSRFKLAIDFQNQRCIPEYRIYLVDHYDVSPKRGAFFVFQTDKLQPIYPSHASMLKKMTGLPGDTVIIHQEQIVINQALVSTGLPLASRFNRQPEAFNRAFRIEEGAYWFSGTHEESFDSRYYGTIVDKELIGRAYPIW